MNERIGRLNSLLIGKETTAGTEASTFYAVPLTSVGYIKPMVEYIDNESGFGRIEALTEKTLVKKMSETSLEGRAGTTTFGHLLTGLFGQSSSPTLVETGVYKHNFTILNNNNHKSYSIVTDNVAQELSLYNMLDKIALKCEVGQVLTFTAGYKGKIGNATSGKTVSFISESPFKICEMTVKFASTVAGLTGASATKLVNLNFEVAKNVMEIMEIGGACEPTSLHNQQFGITGDMELLYRGVDDFKGYNSAGTNQAMRITITGSTLIGATKFNELNFDFAKLNFDEWDKTNSNDELINQTLGFTGLYSLSDTSMLTGYIQNSQSTSY